MKAVRKTVALILCVCALLTLSACSAKKSAKLQICSAAQQEEYLKAAKKHFSNVGWTRADLPEDAPGAVSGDDTRYAVIISENEDVLGLEAVEGKRYTILVCDKPGSDVRICMRYCVGTTDRCVVKGNVVEGEMSFNRDMTLSGTAASNASERAGLIFDIIYQTLVDIEGK